MEQNTATTVTENTQVTGQHAIKGNPSMWQNDRVLAVGDVW